MPVGMDQLHVGTDQHHRERERSWELYFTEAFDCNDQRALLIEGIATFLRTAAGWQLISTHLSLRGNKVAVGLDLAALLDRWGHASSA